MKLTDDKIEEMVDFYHKGDNHYARHDFREGVKTARDFYEAQTESQKSAIPNVRRRFDSGLNIRVQCKSLEDKFWDGIVLNDDGGSTVDVISKRADVMKIERNRIEIAP